MISNLEWFRTFKAIYETGSLTRAAQSLYISQPGVSLHLNSLEAFTGHKLFDRAARKMVPTERGKVLYNSILEPLNRLENVEQQFNRSSLSEKATISVGMCFETFQFTLEKHLPRLPFNLIIKFGDYAQMHQDLDNGVLDLVITPQKSGHNGLQYTPFSKERIVLVAGKKSDTTTLSRLIKSKNWPAAAEWLQQQTWYSTAADMEHMKKFWHQNFQKHPDFRPNFIVPNICSILRCLSDGKGFAVVPDFLCRDEIAQGKIRQVWEGHNPIVNTLYFGTRKRTIYHEEIRQIQRIFEQP